MLFVVYLFYIIDNSFVFVCIHFYYLTFVSIKYVVSLSILFCSIFSGCSLLFVRSFFLTVTLLFFD